MTQYIECKFPSSERRYNYGNEGPEVRIGDYVEVLTNTGMKTVEVTGILDGPPQLPSHAQLKFIHGLSSGSIPE